ncbi:MAG: hypothetical protein E3J72_12750 [Planctomycetota bacterium]|nr:MAG: hypothetical protein E3J72_12750 [Planctomycetota bacterium]
MFSKSSILTLLAIIVIALILAVCAAWYHYSILRKVRQVVEMKGDWQPVARELLKSNRGKELLFRELDKKFPAKHVHPFMIKAEPRYIRCKRKEPVRFKIIINNASQKVADIYFPILVSGLPSDEFTERHGALGLKFLPSSPDGNDNFERVFYKTPRILPVKLEPNREQVIDLRWFGYSYESKAFIPIGTDFIPGIYFMQIRYNPFMLTGKPKDPLISNMIVLVIE